MSLESMTVKQLKERAAKIGVKIKANAKKDDIISAIESAEPVAVVAEVIEPGEDKAVEPCKDLIVSLPSSISIDDNIRALDAYVKEQIAPYVGAKFDIADEKKVKEARQCMADLNNLKKPIEEERKRIKRTYEKPLKVFESRVGEITEKIDDARNQIKKQVDEADEAFRDDRRARLARHYVEFAELLAPVVPYEKLHDQKWCNRTTKYADAEKELESKVDAIASDWESLKSIDLEFFDQAEAHFFSTLSLGDAVAYNNKLVSDRKKIDNMNANMAAYGGQSEVPEPAGAPVTSPAPAPVCAPPAPVPEAAPTYQPDYAPAPPPAPVDVPDDPPRPCVMVIDLATTEQMRAIGRFCGSLEPSVTGAFKLGTLDEVYAKEMQRREAAHGRIG